MTGRNRLIFLGAIILAMLAVVVYIQTANGSDLPEVVAERQEAMKSLGGHMKAIGQSLESGSPDGALIAEHASGIAAVGGKIPELFPAGRRLEEGDGKVGAKPAIWEDWPGFEEAANRLVLEANALTAVAESGDATAIQAAFKSVGENGCGGCHTKFRQKVE